MQCSKDSLPKILNLQTNVLWQLKFICPGGDGCSTKKQKKKKKATNNKFPLGEAFTRTTNIYEHVNRNELKLSLLSNKT